MNFELYVSPCHQNYNRLLPSMQNYYMCSFPFLVDFVCVQLKFRQVIQCTHNRWSERIQADNTACYLGVWSTYHSTNREIRPPNQFFEGCLVQKTWDSASIEEAHVNNTAPNLNILGNDLRARYAIVFLWWAEPLALALCWMQTQLLHCWLYRPAHT